MMICIRTTATLDALLQNSFCLMCLDDMSTYVTMMGIWREN
jgi:hypothetical protein